MKRISIHIEEEYLEWLDSRPGTRAEAIRYAIARYYRFVRLSVMPSLGTTGL
jgi:hypothetical protein